jgi:TorA maturation chaperone TorD
MAQLSDEPGSRPIAHEDQARATCYALISRLFYAPPDAELLSELGTADVPQTQDGPESGWQLVEIDKPAIGGSYPKAYATFQAACRNADLASVREEYEAIFGGAGKALITPYTSGYAEPGAPDRHLVALREHLVAWGLARRDAVFEVEDHASAVCDVMRWLIEHDRPLAVQRTFFEEFVYTGLGTFCNAISVSPGTSFYRSVAELARAFLAVECAAFDMHTDT